MKSAMSMKNKTGSSLPSPPPSPTESAVLLPSSTSIRRNDTNRHKVAEMLLQKYPQLSIDQLLEAVRECEHASMLLSGWEGLASCTQEHLAKRRGKVMRKPETRRRISA